MYVMLCGCKKERKGLKVEVGRANQQRLNPTEHFGGHLRLFRLLHEKKGEKEVLNSCKGNPFNFVFSKEFNISQILHPFRRRCRSPHVLRYSTSHASKVAPSRTCHFKKLPLPPKIPTPPLNASKIPLLHAICTPKHTSSFTRSLITSIRTP